MSLNNFFLSLSTIYIFFCMPFVLAQSKTMRVEVEQPIISGDVIISREAAQGRAFEKALSDQFPSAMPEDLRAQRLKNSIKYIQSFRVLEEQRLGDILKMTYEIEIAESAFEIPKSSVPAEIPQSFGAELQLDLVFKQNFPVAEIVDQIKSKLNIPVSSFRLTRSALSLKVKQVKAEELIVKEIQDLVGSRAVVNLVARIEDKPIISGNFIAPQVLVPGSMAPNSISPNALIPNFSTP